MKKTPLPASIWLKGSLPRRAGRRSPLQGKSFFLLFIYIHLAVNSPTSEPAVRTNKHFSLVCAEAAGQADICSGGISPSPSINPPLPPGLFTRQLVSGAFSAEQLLIKKGPKPEIQKGTNNLMGTMVPVGGNFISHLDTLPGRGLFRACLDKTELWSRKCPLGAGGF